MADVERVDGEELVAEIVRMLGGERGDEAASRHARELLAGRLTRRAGDRRIIVRARWPRGTASRRRASLRCSAPARQRAAVPPIDGHGAARASGPSTWSSGCGPGDVAVIDHADLDRIAAEDLIATGVAAVVNVAHSSTGRYPNAGPLLLARAGVRLSTSPRRRLFEQLKDGDR